MPEVNPADALRRSLHEAMRVLWFRGHKLGVVLSQIELFKNPDFIQDLLPLLWERDKAILNLTSSCIAVLLQKVDAMVLPDLDARIREQWPHGGQCSMFDPTQMKRLRSGPSWWGAFAILASHPSGYVRQTAVEQLAAEESGKALPFLLLRTNDWVEPVRNAAAKAVRLKLAPLFSKQLVECLPLVYRLRRAQRHQPLELLREMEKMAGAQSDSFLRDVYPDVSPGFRRYRFRLAKEHGIVPIDRLVVAAAAHPDMFLRILACDWLPDPQVSPTVRYRYAAALLADPAPFVRSRAFWRIATPESEKYRTQIERALLDNNECVQRTACGIWKKSLRGDAPAFYRAKVAEACTVADLVAAMRGLCAEGKLSEEGIVRPFLEHASPKVRRQALRTLVSWGAEDAGHLLQEALRGKSPSYCKEAARLLWSRPTLLPVTVLKEMLVDPAGYHSDLVAAGLLWKLSKWSALPLILLACGSPRTRIQEMGQNALGDWRRNYNKTWSAPTRAEAEAAVRAFKNLGRYPLTADRDLIAVISDLEKVK